MEWLQIVLGIVVVLLFALVFYLWRGLNANIIESPTLGLYNLSGHDFAALLDADKESLGQSFLSVIESTDAPPPCNVLFLYCQIEPDGSVRGSQLGLREIIRDSGAIVVVVASENSVENYKVAIKKTGYGYANLVLTLERNGDKFSRFYKRLFTDMKQGTSMPVAWNKLAPQIPGMEHDSPEGIMLMEAGQIAFK